MGFLLNLCFAAALVVIYLITTFLLPNYFDREPLAI